MNKNLNKINLDNFFINNNSIKKLREELIKQYLF